MSTFYSYLKLTGFLVFLLVLGVSFTQPVFADESSSRLLYLGFGLTNSLNETDMRPVYVDEFRSGLRFSVGRMISQRRKQNFKNDPSVLGAEVSVLASEVDDGTKVSGLGGSYRIFGDAPLYLGRHLGLVLSIVGSAAYGNPVLNGQRVHRVDADGGAKVDAVLFASDSGTFNANMGLLAGYTKFKKLPSPTNASPDKVGYYFTPGGAFHSEHFSIGANLSLPFRTGVSVFAEGKF